MNTPKNYSISLNDDKAGLNIPDNISDSQKKLIDIEILKRNLMNCCSNTSCPIKDSMNWARCVPNGTIEENGIMLVDGFPDEFDSYAGCFTGFKGEILSLAEIPRNSMYFTTLVKCPMVGNLNQSTVDLCLNNYFYKEVQIVKPRLILFTSTAFLACIRGGILPPDSQPKYFFEKVETKIINISFAFTAAMIFDFKDCIKEENVESLKQGLHFLIQ